MPAIKEYTADRAARGFDPSNRAAEIAAGTGRQISTMDYQVGQERARAASNEGRALGDLGQGLAAVGKGVQDYLEQQDALKFYAGQAELMNQMTHAWNKVRTEADPNDPAVAEKFNTDVLGPALEQFGGQFDTSRGREMAASFGARFQEHMFTRQAADAGVAAAQSVEHNLVTASNNHAAALVADPSSLAFVNQTTQQMIDSAKHANPNLTAEQQAHLDDLGIKMRRENTIAAFHGMASKNPSAAEAELAGGFGGEDLTASDRATLGNYAHAQANIAKEEKKAAEVEARRQEQQSANADANKLFTDAINPETGELNVGPAYFQGVKDYAAKHPTEETGQAKSLFAVGQKAIADELSHKYQTSDPNVREDFNARMTLPPEDPRALSPVQVDNEYTAGRLSTRDHAMYRQEALDMQKDPAKRDAYAQFNKFLTAQKSTITRSSPVNGNFAQDDQRYGYFQFDMKQQFDQAYRDGNWKELLDPRNAKFLGQQTPKYAYSTQQGIDLTLQNMNSGTQAVATPPAANAPKKPLGDFMKEGK